MGGGILGKTQQNSDIVLLCIYFLSNYCKNIQNIKNCQALPTPPTGGGVWCDTPAVNLEPSLTRWHDWKEVNKYRGSHPQGQSLLKYQPVCLWYHYTKSIKNWTIACRGQEKALISVNLWASAMLFQKRGKTSHVTTLWGGGMQAKASKIVILCYFLSKLYLINYCKIIHEY